MLAKPGCRQAPGFQVLGGFGSKPGCRQHMHRVMRSAHGTQERIFDMRVHREKNAETHAVHIDAVKKSELSFC